MAFELHPQLEADTAEVTRLGLCRVLLMDDTTYPWLILVPERPDLRDLHDIAPAEDAMLMTEIQLASQALQLLHSPDKINVAALGNQVPQLHVHVIARRTDDPAWPGPVWGAGQAEARDQRVRDAIVRSLREAIES